MNPTHDAADRSNGYERAADEFMARRTDSPIGVEEVRSWARGLRPGASVLDVGCGHGVPLSKALMEEGCAVSGIDASPTLVSAFRTRFPGVEIERAGVEDAQLFRNRFDGVLAWGLMFLLEPEIQGLVIRNVSSALKPGGQFLFTAPEQSCAWVDILTGRRSTSLGPAAYEELLRRLGLDLLKQFKDSGDNHYYLAGRR